MTSPFLVALLAGLVAVSLSDSLDAKEHMLCGKRLIETFRQLCNVASCSGDSTLAAYKDIEQGISEKCCLEGCTADYLKGQCCLRSKKDFGDVFLKATPFKPDKRWRLSRVPFERPDADWIF
uniref:IlGF domain-containing protein n=1 Tax=Steinernema glaseri TaxID=37863 RepID=A0A1I7YI48_9BILA